MRIKIETPVTDHTGLVGHVAITDGVGIADSDTNAAELAYCHRSGYTLTVAETGEPYDPTAAVAAPADPAEQPMPRRSGSAEAWRAYAIAHGVAPEEAETLSRDQLVERFTSTEETES